MIELTLAVLAVLVASAIFSGAEAALFSLPLPKAQQMAESSANGRVLLSLKTALARPIATIVIGNNLVNIVGTFYVAQLSQEALAASPWARAAFPFVLTLAVILFSEILPKNVGERYSTSLGGFIARPLSWLTWFAYPAVMLIE